MKIELHEITIREIVRSYVDNREEGVLGYSGKLDIRPKYQREFVYDEEKRNAVIDTISKGFPLNVMYWVVNKENGNYEVLDGQQRTISFCQYVNGDFSVKEKYFNNLTQDEKDKILNYKTMVYFCEGTDSEKLEWFKTINIAGEPLTDQELRNAVYTGPWLSDAKIKFSKTNCVAQSIAKDYLNGSPKRQEYLETAIKWISKGKITEYMAKNQNAFNANELWLYFQAVIEWVKQTFKYRIEMKGISWGTLYDHYGKTVVDTNVLEEKISKLMKDDDVTNKKGIYEYVFDNEEKHLNIRTFTKSQKEETYEKQEGICPRCKKHFDFDEMEGDHITPWHLGGKTSNENCQMLCKECNRRKGGI